MKDFNKDTVQYGTGTRYKNPLSRKVMVIGKDVPVPILYLLLSIQDF